MHGLVMLNKDYELIRDCIIWSDQRASDEVDDMVNLLPEETWINITGNPPMAAWTAAKILWVRKTSRRFLLSVVTLCYQKIMCDLG